VAVEITYDEMSPEMEALFAASEDVQLSEYTNVAAGIGFNVIALVRRGLWVKKREHRSDSPFGSYTVYGPPQPATSQPSP
jgi:hypothetical protein